MYAIDPDVRVPEPNTSRRSPRVRSINNDIDLYDLNLSVEPVEKLRSQIKFKNIDQLSSQIRNDRENALRIFKNYKK